MNICEFGVLFNLCVWVALRQYSNVMSEAQFEPHRLYIIWPKTVIIGTPVVRGLM